jgi:vitamin-K-epoxide reductase (warfarin-sensitive)
MKYALVILSLIGVIAASLALREHYRPYGESVCDINAHWDCGIVNHSPYAVIPQGSPNGVPVADVGIAGYIVLGILAWKRAYKIMLALAVPALAFSLYLAHLEASPNALGVWCLYCAISLGIISLITLALLGLVIAGIIRRQPRLPPQGS